MASLKAFLAALVVFIAVFSSSVEAHGWMSNPKPRGQYLSPPKYSHLEYEPAAVTEDVTTSSKFICRNDAVSARSNWVSLTAGSSQTISLSWNAPHIGDCFAYLSYDGDKPENQMKWFKIWEQHKCSPDDAKSGDVSNYNVPIPSYLPSGSHVVFRWEWYALHAYGGSGQTVEFYANCFDATVTGVANGALPLPQVSIPGHLPTPAGDLYWLPYAFPAQAEKFTGPQVATPNGQPYTPPASTTTSTSAAPATTSTSAAPSTTSTSSTPSSTTSSNPSTTSPAACAAADIGSANCPCTAGGACDAGLQCSASRVCVAPTPCSGGVGAVNCACTAGGACDPGLECNSNKVCVDISAIQDAAATVFVSASLVLVSLFVVYLF